MSDKRALAERFCQDLPAVADVPSEEIGCSICFDTLGGSDTSVEPAERRMIQTNCNHSFHYLCLSKWLSQNGNGRCPFCRRDLLNSNESPLDERFFEDADYSGAWSLYNDQPFHDEHRGNQSWLNTSEQALRMAEQYERAQHQRLSLLHALVALTEENTTLTHAELEYCRRISNGEHEQPDMARRARLADLRTQQNHLFREVWIMDVRVEDLLSEELRLRYIADAELLSLSTLQ